MVGWEEGAAVSRIQNYMAAQTSPQVGMLASSRCFSGPPDRGLHGGEWTTGYISPQQVLSFFCLPQETRAGLLNFLLTGTPTDSVL